MDGRRWMVFVVRDRVITDFKNMADPPPSPPLSPPPQEKSLLLNLYKQIGKNNK